MENDSATLNHPIEETRVKSKMGKVNGANMKKQNANHFAEVSEARSEEIDVMIQSIGCDIKKMKTTNDFNQNVIEPNSCSFDQLCSMINDLEQNIAGHRAEPDDVCYRKTGVGNEARQFRDVDREYSNNHVSLERNFLRNVVKYT